MSNDYFGTVLRINDDHTEFVINKGSAHGIHDGLKFLILELGEDILDPETGESLGVLEIVKGEAVVLHVQEKMATLISNEFITKPGTEEIIYHNGQSRSNYGLRTSWLKENAPTSKIVTEPVKMIKSLVKVKVGDKVKITR